MHTIKGSSGLFGFDAIVSFTHEAETLLDKVRNNQSAINDELISLLLECKDHTANLIEHCLADNDKRLPVELESKGEQLIKS